MIVYLDNAATTPMLPEVVEVMRQSMISDFGNPSSTHQAGRRAKSLVETARKNFAKHFSVSSNEIIFTSSATEANNFILNNAVENLNVKRIITAKTEHYAVLNVVEKLKDFNDIIVDFVDVDHNGQIDLIHLESLIKQTPLKTLVSLMWVNNEIGNILPIERVSIICKQNNVLFHSDTVQGLGYQNLNLKEISIDFITASAHKFHGPKGVGFVYVKNGLGIRPLLYGGNQEKGVRSSTENVHGILGMDAAFKVKIDNLEQNTAHIKMLKSYCIQKLDSLKFKICYNGLSNNLQKSSHKILNIRLPEKKEMFLFHLDLAGVLVSGGSACQSGAHKGSHVLQAFLNEEEQEKTSLRVSFSKLNTKQDIDYFVQKLSDIFHQL